MGGVRWPLRKEDLARLQQIEHGMLRWLCGVRAHARIGLDAFCCRVDTPNLEPWLRSIRWYGHVNQLYWKDRRDYSRKERRKTWHSYQMMSW